MTKITIEGLESTVNALMDRVNKMEKKMEIIQNRLPIWATIMLTLMGSTITGLITHAVGS